MATRRPPVSEDEITTGELSRRFADLADRLESLIVRLDVQFVRRDLYDIDQTNLRQRVGNLESRSEWLVRTVGAIIITAVLGLVFSFVHFSGSGH